MAVRHEKELLDQLIQKNVDSIKRIEEAALQSRTRSDRIVDTVAGFCGSLAFVYAHVALFTFWIVANTVPMFAKDFKFDPPPFNLLTLVVSLEAIILSTFIMISQNRQQRIADQRNHLDLQINLLAEQEASQMLQMLDMIMQKLEIHTDRKEVTALGLQTDPERIAELTESVGEQP